MINYANWNTSLYKLRYYLIAMAICLGGATQSLAIPKTDAFSGISEESKLKLFIDRGGRVFAHAKNCKLASANGIKVDLLNVLSRRLTAISMVNAERLFDLEADRAGYGPSRPLGTCNIGYLNSAIEAYSEIRATFSSQ